MEKILVVDDDTRVLVLIKKILERNSYQVTTINEINSLDLTMFKGYDLILLDVMMGDISGFDICKEIRSSVNTPIVFVTAKNMEDDIVNGFRLGGDDYITKPFGVEELLARVEAHLRRDRRLSDKGKSRNEMIGDVMFSFDQKKVFVEGKAVKLVYREYEICEFLAIHSQRVYTKEEIYEYVYREDSNALFRSISEYIYQIRIKFKEVGIDPIETVWGVGYKWKKINEA